MDHEGTAGGKRLRLTGARFEGGRLPIDSLIELQKYQEVVRIAARAEWRREHPGEALPSDLDASVGLAIERIDEGSADVLMAFEQPTVYAEYRTEAQEAVEAILGAAYSETPASLDLQGYSPQADPELYEAASQLGATLATGQSIEVYPTARDSPPVTITVETRERAIERLVPMEGFLLSPEPVQTSELQASDESLLGRVTVLDADKKKFGLVLTDGTAIRGWYRENPDLLEDFRDLVNSTADGPLTRITGTLQYKSGQPFRFKSVSSIERVEFDNTEWGQRLTEFAALPPGWEDGEGEQISFAALDAAQMVLRAVERMGAEEPGIYPSSEGGVLIEWATRESVRSIEITADGAFEMFSLLRDQGSGEHSESEDLTQAISFIEGQKI